MARRAWSPPQLRAHQRERLTALLRHAAAASPYYARILPRDTGLGTARLEQLPTLSKATLMERFDEIVTDPRLRRRALEAHLASPRAAGPLDGHRVLSTAGTSGLRGIVVYSRTEFAVWVAAFLRVILAFGVTPETRVLAIGAPSARHISQQMFAELMAGQPSSAPQVSVSTPVPELVRALNAYRPEAISTYPSIAALLAEEQLAGRLRIAPAVIGTGAEVLTEDMRRRIVGAFGLEPQQAYVTTETPVLASTSGGQAGMCLWEDLSLIEVVDEHDRPVPPGIPGYKVLVTNLVNRTLPLIRYELSDSVTPAAEPGAGTGAFRRISSVDGRSDDAITLPAAGGGTVAVHPFHLRAPFAAIPDVLQYQVLHEAGGLSVSVVLRDGAGGHTVQRVRHVLAQRLADQGALPPSITVTPVRGIDREAGHAGKLKLIKSMLRAAG
jgi:phenylacetate-coenzyme A ligase PaaK-like adenylate-forming protein